MFDVVDSEVRGPDDVERYGIPELLPEFLDRGGDMLAEFGLEETPIPGEPDRPSVHGGHADDRRVIGDMMDERLKAFAKRFDAAGGRAALVARGIPARALRPVGAQREP